MRRRLRDRAPGPPTARARGVPRRAAERSAAAALRGSRARPGPRRGGRGSRCPPHRRGRRGGARARRALARLTTGAHARVSYPSPVNLARRLDAYERLIAARQADRRAAAPVAHALGGVARLRRARARRHPAHLRGWHVLDALGRMRAQRLCRPRVRSACRAHARAPARRARDSAARGAYRGGLAAAAFAPRAFSERLGDRAFLRRARHRGRSTPSPSASLHCRRHSSA